MQDREKRLEDALQEIADIAALSDGPAAKFYGMLAEMALENNAEKLHFDIYTKGQMSYS